MHGATIKIYWLYFHNVYHVYREDGSNIFLQNVLFSGFNFFDVKGENKHRAKCSKGYWIIWTLFKKRPNCHLS